MTAAVPAPAASPSLARQYRARLRAILTGVDRLERASLARAVQDLARLRADLVQAAARQRPVARDRIDASALAREITQAIEDYEARLVALAIATQALALSAGALLVDGIARAVLDRTGRGGGGGVGAAGVGIGSGKGGGLPPVTTSRSSFGGFRLPEISIRGVFPLIPDGLVEAASALAAEEVTTVTRRFRTDMLGRVRRAALGGLTTFEAMEQIDAVLPERAKSARLADGVGAGAERILRTQVARAFNRSAALRARDLAKKGGGAGAVVGVLEKEWIATIDTRTRADHLAAHGQRVGVDDAFDVGGEALDHPGDPSGSATNVINCRCRMIVVPAGVSGL